MSGETFFIFQMMLGFGVPLALCVHQLWALSDSGPQGGRAKAETPPTPPAPGGEAAPLAPTVVASKPLPDCLVPKRLAATQAPETAPARELEPA